jgi:dTDP-4-amino-4,6-dideoxygalactose transaminase
MSDRVAEFEGMFAKFCGTKYALGTNSGTSSIEIPLRAIDVDGGTVVMPSNTYMATPLAAIKAGARVIFVDCDKNNLQMDPVDLERKIRKDTRAVVLVHIGGIISPDIEKIMEICRKRGIPLIEDAAHAHGAEFYSQSSVVSRQSSVIENQRSVGRRQMGDGRWENTGVRGNPTVTEKNSRKEHLSSNVKNRPIANDRRPTTGDFWKRAGSFGLAGSFSFYPTKVFTTAEGGMMVTDSEEIYRKGIVLREHGKADHGFNVHTEIGDNWRYSEIHAVLGIQQMKKADYLIGERRRLAALYDSLLEDIDEVRPLEIPTYVKSSYYKYIVFPDEGISRDSLKKEMKDRFGVMLTGEVYADPCHSQPVFKKYPKYIANNRNDKFPQTDYACRHHVCLPLYPGLTDKEVKYVVDSLKKTLTTNLR